MSSIQQLRADIHNCSHRILHTFIISHSLIENSTSIRHNIAGFWYHKCSNFVHTTRSLYPPIYIGYGTVYIFSSSSLLLLSLSPSLRLSLPLSHHTLCCHNLQTVTPSDVFWFSYAGFASLDFPRRCQILPGFTKLT